MFDELAGTFLGDRVVCFLLKWEILWEIEQFESYSKMAVLQFKMVGVRSMWCSCL
jgi:hypothetical protein